MSSLTKRLITSKDKANAARLRKIWDHRRIDLNLTQKEMAKLCGYTQPTFNQYLHCVIPLNTDAIFKIAAVLKISPEEIDPDFSKVHSLFKVSPAEIETIRIPVIGSTSGNKLMLQEVDVMLEPEQLMATDTYAGITVDNSLYEETVGYVKGTVLVVSLNETNFKKNQNVILRRRGKEEFEIVRIERVFKHKIVVTKYTDFEKLEIKDENIMMLCPIKVVSAPD